MHTQCEYLHDDNYRVSWISIFVLKKWDKIFRRVFFLTENDREFHMMRLHTYMYACIYCYHEYELMETQEMD